MWTCFPRPHPREHAYFPLIPSFRAHSTYTQIRFMYNHNLLQLAGRPAWLIFEGGRHVSPLPPFPHAFLTIISSRTYIDTILSTLPQECLHLETPVRALRSAHGGGVELTTASGRTEHFDHAVLAVHTDTALRILEAGGGATPDERDILGRVTWKKNESVLHSDAKVGLCSPLWPEPR